MLSFDRQCLGDPRDQCQLRDSVQLSNAKRLSVSVLVIKTWDGRPAFLTPVLGFLRALFKKRVNALAPVLNQPTSCYSVTAFKFERTFEQVLA